MFIKLHLLSISIYNQFVSVPPPPIPIPIQSLYPIFWLQPIATHQMADQIRMCVYAQNRIKVYCFFSFLSSNPKWRLSILYIHFWHQMTVPRT